MEQKTDISDIRNALLQKLLQGELPQAKQAEGAVQRVNTQSQKGPVAARPVLLQTGSRAPFFFLHGDWSGHTSFCFKLAHGLGPDQPFYILEPYSFESHQVLPSVETMATEQLALIREIQPEGPYLLGGFCNGSLIVYEMARHLHRSGQKVDLLVLIDPYFPRQARIFEVFKHIGSLLHLNQEQQLVWFLRLEHMLAYLTMRHSNEYEFIKTFDARIDSWFPPLETLRQEYNPLFRWAVAQYKPSFYPRKVTIFWDEVELNRRRWWQKMAKGKDGEVEVAIIRGSHMTCKTEHVDSMAACLQRYVLQAQGELPTTNRIPSS